MDLSHGAAQVAAAASPVQVAKAALRRLALERVEPTPENYARAYAAEAGHRAPASPPSDSPDWTALLRRLVHGLERGDRRWTVARRKDSLQRVLAGAGGDPSRLHDRVDRLLRAWDDDAHDSALAPLDDPAPESRAPAGAGGDASASPPTAGADGDAAAWRRVALRLAGALRSALPADDPLAAGLAAALGDGPCAPAAEGATGADLGRFEALGDRAGRLLAHRQHLVDELAKLCVELSEGLTELAEDDSWARGQCEMLRARLGDGLNVRSVRAASALLADARKHQAALRGERDQARDALKELIRGMLDEVGAIGEHTDRFQASVGRHSEAIARADSLAGLAGVVREMLHDSGEVQALVHRTHDRLRAEHERAGAMQQRVLDLEGELRRLSDEAATDALTQVANRRGLARAFDAERERLRRGDAAALAVGLIDIDNFKKLNDTHGHAAGDVALQRLAAEVRDRLRPGDTLARFGGEEFVVLLPGTDAAEAQQVLTRLQRQLTAALFMHEQQEVFVTFSAGVTALRGDEPLEAALERADEALYEAKRSGKNRTCVG